MPRDDDLAVHEDVARIEVQIGECPAVAIEPGPRALGEPHVLPLDQPAEEVRGNSWREALDGLAGIYALGRVSTPIRRTVVCLPSSSMTTVSPSTIRTTLAVVPGLMPVLIAGAGPWRDPGRASQEKNRRKPDDPDEFLPHGDNLACSSQAAQ